MAPTEDFAARFGEGEYLSGMNPPVSDERDDLDLPITGGIPLALCGSFLRNSPDPAFPPGSRNHIFDGDGMLHRIRLADGRASYHNRWIESLGLAAERRAGRALYGGRTSRHVESRTRNENRGDAAKRRCRLDHLVRNGPLLHLSLPERLQ
jgi:carotenoid cleavage dioxygenase-like enzyme